MEGYSSKVYTKTRRGFRPISLTSCAAKIFERLVQDRLDYLAETNNWLPNFQYGLRKGRSSNDAVAMLVSDIYRAYGRGESLAVLALDIKGAFNSIKLIKVLEELKTLRAPGNMINFVGFLIVQRNLTFSHEMNTQRVSGVGVPQGGLTPIFFNLTLRRIEEVLPPEVKILMYADDIIIYVTGTGIEGNSCGILVEAYENIRNWLIDLEVSPGKTQYTIFTQKRDVSSTQHSIDLQE